jgi:hypothetical protein
MNNTYIKAITSQVNAAGSNLAVLRMTSFTGARRRPTEANTVHHNKKVQSPIHSEEE